MTDGSVTDEQAHAWLQEIADAGWISLHYDSPALGGSDRAEISGGGYNRFKMSFSQPNNRAIWSMVDARFTGLTQTKLVYFGVWNRRSPGDKAGFLRAYGDLPDPVMVLNGRGYVLHAGQLAVSFG
jgi:hypothetical protein